MVKNILRRWRRYSHIHLFILVMSFAATTQLTYDCPNDWEIFGVSCYKYVFYPTRDYQDAKTDCQMHGAGLISINTADEQTFVTGWIKQYDGEKNMWYTSGVEMTTDGGAFRWEGDGTRVPEDLFYWLSESDRHRDGEIIVFKWAAVETRVGWSRGPRSASLPYICEIPQAEAYRIVQDNRDFNYGTVETDPNKLLRGPTFTVEAEDLVVISVKQKLAAVECVASGNPQPTHGWSRRQGNTVTDITSELDPRYILTNGRLTIESPEDGADSGHYQCRAENEFGMILGSSIQISFGYMGEFSNVPSEEVRAFEYSGAAIECNPPSHKPALSYQWYKNDPGNFVRPSLQPYLFISSKSKLYFSEVTRVDEGNFYCIATLAANYGGMVGSYTPSRTSLPTTLRIVDGTAREWGPEIHNDFIAVLPPNPRRGQLVRLECFAYGTSPITYYWTREDREFSDRVMFQDHNRIMYIRDIELEDAGRYKCSCYRTSTAMAQKSINLVVVAKPYFIFPLKHKHVDIGSQLTWRCGARAVPSPAYAWYKNGKQIQTVPGEIEIQQNILTIKGLDAGRHAGMYQCIATNIYGTTVSSAQLRVLALAPTFAKRPVEAQQSAAVGGNTTFLCEPEAAPFPEIKWAKGGSDLGLRPGDTSGRIKLLGNGNLLITAVQSSDQGTYTCTATNAEGTDSSSGYLSVVTGTTISRRPSDTSVVMNNTAFVFCQASYNPRFDMVYIWKFNGKDIDVANDPYYGWGTGSNVGGLYIRHAQFRHAGQYECTARTVIDDAKGVAKLTVDGPPGPPAGVFVDVRSVTPYSMKVRWTVGTDHNRPITSYIIQAMTVLHPIWNTITPSIPTIETIEQGEDKRRYVVTRLKPGNGYRFRVMAINILGVSQFSLPSDIFQTPGAPPSLAPSHVGGGEGRVGILTITWVPLDASEHNGQNIGYNIYWRRKGVNNDLQTWTKDSVRGNASYFATTVGVANYYLEYETKVQAFNIHGSGPNSSVEIVYSAEGLPTGMPLGVFADPYNATSILVHWNEVPDTRVFMKGKVKGYQVNYYIADIDDPLVWSVTYLGQRKTGLVVGLYPGTFYWFGVQVYNTAGLGPESETDKEQTYANPPELYPTEVFVHSVDYQSIRVTFRGVSTNVGEEPLLGYKLRYWLMNDDIRGARDVMLGKTTEGYINGIEKGYVYEMRVLGFSNGGDGKMCPSILFTLEGGQVRLDPGSTDIVSGGYSTSSNCIHILSSIALTMLYLLYTDRD